MVGVPTICGHCRQESLGGLKADAARNARYQSILQVPVSTYDDLDEVKLDWDLKHKLWNALDTWTTKTEGWQATPFANIRADRIGEEVDGYYKIASIAERGLPGNLVAPLLKDMVTSPSSIRTLTATLKVRLYLRHGRT